jgi:hypothetical protein
VAFKKAYKDIYDYFFTETVPKPPGPYATYNSAQPWGQKFEQFYRSATGSYDVLRTHFLFQRVQQLGPSIWRVAPPGEGAVPLSVAQMNGLPLVLSLIQ